MLMYSPSGGTVPVDVSPSKVEQMRGFGWRDSLAKTAKQPKADKPSPEKQESKDGGK